MTLKFFLLICGHALGDFALQNDFVAKFKSRHAAFYTGETVWPYVLGAHSLIHGLIVFLITKNIYFGIAETLAHFLIDFVKCENKIGFHTDQWLHVCCKILWAVL